MSVGSPYVPPYILPTLFCTGHLQPETVPELSRLWWLHTKMSPSYSLLLETVPCPVGGGEGEPQVPGGLGMLTLGGTCCKMAASAQLQGDGGDEEVQETPYPRRLHVPSEKEKHQRRHSPAARSSRQSGGSYLGALYQGLVLQE